MNFLLLKLCIAFRIFRTLNYQIFNLITILQLVDLGDSGFGGDPWGGSASSKSNNSNRADDLFAGKSDPWATTNGAAAKTNGHAVAADPWGSNKPANGPTSPSTNPWFGSNGGQQAAAVSAVSDPWASGNSNGHGTHEKLDDFDMFTNNRVQQPTSPVNDPFGDFLAADKAAASTNPWSGSDSTSTKKPTTSFDPFASPTSPPVTKLPNSTSSSAIRKTPESFLGENSSLVNLENLIPARPKSTNPFGSTAANPSTMTSSSSIGQLNNPFAAQQQQQQAMANRPINQMQPSQQQQQPFAFPFNTGSAMSGPMNGQPLMMPPIINGGGYMHQQQPSLFPSLPPLIPPTSSQFGYNPQPQATNPAPAASTNPFLNLI
jgi:hypothetical protein